MFDTLLQLPLFQGLAHEDFTGILEKVKLHFAKHKPGEILIKPSTPCRQLLFVLKGEVTVTTTPENQAYSLTEHYAVPCVIEPQALFGMNTVYISNYRARTEVHTISIDKASVMDVLFSYSIFRLNYMNMVSNRAQTLYTRLWSSSTNNDLANDSPEARIVHFILSHVERATGEKTLKIKMEDLALIVNEARITVSKTLNSLQEQGVLELHRGEIIIPNAEKLYQIQ